MNARIAWLEEFRPIQAETLPSGNRDDLRRLHYRDSTTSLDRWCTTFIKRFKTRTAVALSQLVGQMYSLNDIRYTSPKAFIQHMLHLAKSAEMHTTNNQLIWIWNQFAVNLRRDLPESQAYTIIG